MLNGFLFVYFHGCVLKINAFMEHCVRVRDNSEALFIIGLVFLNETNYKKAGTDSPTPL